MHPANKNDASERTLRYLKRQLWKWRRKPLRDFYVTVGKHYDGSKNITNWKCTIPGKNGTIWMHGRYNISIKFPYWYPLSPPAIYFKPPIMHPNVDCRTGKVSTSQLVAGHGWHGKCQLRHILLMLQELLCTPEIKEAVNAKAKYWYLHKRDVYSMKVSTQKFALLRQRDKRRRNWEYTR